MTGYVKSGQRAVGVYNVYELYGHDNRLLYVGITRQDPSERLDEHRYQQPWAPEIREQRVVNHDLVRGDALRIEKQLIRTKRPIYNLQHSRNRSAAKMAISGAEASYGLSRADLASPPGRRKRPLRIPSRRRGKKSDAALFVSIAIILFQVWEKLSPSQRKWVIALSLVGLCVYFVSTEIS